MISNPIRIVPATPITKPTLANAFGIANNPVPITLLIKVARDLKLLEKIGAHESFVYANITYAWSKVF